MSKRLPLAKFGRPTIKRNGVANDGSIAERIIVRCLFTSREVRRSYTNYLMCNGITIAAKQQSSDDWNGTVWVYDVIGNVKQAILHKCVVEWEYATTQAVNPNAVGGGDDTRSAKRKSYVRERQRSIERGLTARIETLRRSVYAFAHHASDWQSLPFPSWQWEEHESMIDTFWTMYVETFAAFVRDMRWKAVKSNVREENYWIDVENRILAILSPAKQERKPSLTYVSDEQRQAEREMVAFLMQRHPASRYAY